MCVLAERDAGAGAGDDPQCGRARTSAADERVLGQPFLGLGGGLRCGRSRGSGGEHRHQGEHRRRRVAPGRGGHQQWAGGFPVSVLGEERAQGGVERAEPGFVGDPLEQGGSVEPGERLAQCRVGADLGGQFRQRAGWRPRCES